LPSWRFGRRNDKKSAQSAHHHRVQWLRTAAVFGFGDLFDAIRCNSQRKNHLIISRAAACGNLAPGLQKRLACALRLNSIRKLKSDMSPKVRFEPHFIPLERRRMLDEFMCPQHNHLARFDKCSFSAILLMMSALSAFFLIPRNRPKWPRQTPVTSSPAHVTEERPRRRPHRARRSRRRSSST